MSQRFTQTITTIRSVGRCVGHCGLEHKNFFEANTGIWAFGSMLAAILALLISGIGLLFIYGQLKANEKGLATASDSAKAAADATKIAYNSTRPWIKFEVSKAFLTFNSDNPEEVSCQLNYVFKNIGKTPAIECALRYNPFPTGYTTNADSAAELEKLRSSTPYNPRVLFPEDSIDEGFSSNFPFPRQPNEDFLGFNVVAAITYKAAVDGEEYWTPVVLTLQIDPPPEDKLFRYYRGMGHVSCLVIPLTKETPNPT